MDVEQSTTLVQGVGFLLGGALVLVGLAGETTVVGLSLTALGVGIVAIGFVVATAGSLVTSMSATGQAASDKRIQTGMQGLAAAGFTVLFVALAADLGLGGILAGTALVLAAIGSRSYLEKRD